MKRILTILFFISLLITFGAANASAAVYSDCYAQIDWDSFTISGGQEGTDYAWLTGSPSSKVHQYLRSMDSSFSDIDGPYEDELISSGFSDLDITKDFDSASSGSPYMQSRAQTQGSTGMLRAEATADVATNGNVLFAHGVANSYYSGMIGGLSDETITLTVSVEYELFAAVMADNPGEFAMAAADAEISLYNASLAPFIGLENPDQEVDGIILMTSDIPFLPSETRTGIMTASIPIRNGQFVDLYMEVSAGATVNTAAPVPEPVTLLMFSTGLLGLLGFRKKF